ncbi:MAG: YvrJ family protein [Sporomusaceae bacterium]|nr:YvrJ family protein [Sporomusaceae bacterium]
MDVAPLLTAAANYGFPMVVSIYLLVRIEKRLDALSDSINNLAKALSVR